MDRGHYRRHAGVGDVGMNKDEAFAIWAGKHNMDDGHLPWETDGKVLLAVFTAGWDAHAESLKQATMPWEGASDSTPAGVFSSISPEEIYAAYPRKVGRAAALQSIKKAMEKVRDPAKLYSAVLDYASAVKTWAPTTRFTANGTDTVPHPTTWFNQERWTDDRSEWQRGGQKANPSQFSKTYQ